MSLLVSLSFDDGLDVHLDRVLPRLDQYGMPGTFYVPLDASTIAQRHREWQGAAANGHELGCHTIFHPAVSSKPWVTPGIALESYSLDRMNRELAVAATMLRVLDGQTQRTFAFPCGNCQLGKQGVPRRLLRRFGLDRTRLAGWVDRFHLDLGASLIDYTPLVRSHFFAARRGGLPSEDLPPLPGNRFAIQSFEADGQPAANLEEAVEQARTRGGWLVFCFHGIGGGHRLSCAVDAFDHLLAVLSRTPELEVVTVLEGAKRLWPV